MKRTYGWKRDEFDPLDHIMHCGASRPRPLNDLQNLCGPKMPDIYDQGPVGSCTGNGAARGVDQDRAEQGLPFLYPSRLGLYYGVRKIEGTVDQDSGGQIRDVIKVAAKEGAAPESLWPYDPSKFSIEPPAEYYTEAAKHRALTYSKVPQADYYIGCCLQYDRRIVVFGFEVFPEFESEEVAHTGIVPMPKAGQTPIGGHCVTLVGRDVVNDRYLCANSWGTSWGLQGYFWMPRPYVLNAHLASDFWKITSEAA